jgi:V-type H+-transporting ATPase subunit A
MMRCIVHYYDLARKAIIESSGDAKITWNVILNQTKPLFVKLSQMKFEVPISLYSKNPTIPKPDMINYFTKFADEITLAYRNLTEK